MNRPLGPPRRSARSNALEALKCQSYLDLIDTPETNLNAFHAFQRNETPETTPETKSLEERDLRQSEEHLNANNANNASVFVCVDCQKPVEPEALLCDTCYSSRKVVPILEWARRREARRQREIERLSRTPCPTCDVTDWSVNGRGDSYCRSCFPARRTP